MKKILSLLGTITLIGTSTTSLVACNTPQYTEKELADLKEKNNININGNILEWIASQEKPFSKVDNKYYFVVWRSDTNSNWRIIKFLNDTNSKKELDSYGRYKLIFKEYSPFYDFTLLIRGERGDADHTWKDDNGTYFKFLYRWNLVDKQAPDLYLDNKNNINVK
ncbi:lipoprotein [Spiroplasma endosymbiont of Seladonia tumulorum]|uniref:lipoprotein n=1 Tax=Spiroplasma endosymbiont of Seladonia tumulorum TaxID=3066321 RepID=UPI0030D3B42D